MKARTKRRAFVVPAVILGGIVLMVVLITSRKPPEQVMHAVTGALVEVIEARRVTQDVMIESTGDVTAQYEVSVMPQVSGKVEWVHPDLLAGGRFMKNDLMMRIEQDDYELRVQQAEAQVASAEYQQQVAQANAQIAKEEWEMLRRSRSSNDQPDPLVLHEPQLKQAEAGLRSAMAALEQAKLNLARTEIRAPFNARVLIKNVAPGQLVGPNASVARIYSTDVAEIEVSLPVNDLVYMDIPGARAEVSYESGGKTHVYEGYVHREVGALSANSRLAKVIVRVDDPFTRSAPEQPTLQLGAFVSVQLHGRPAPGVIRVPRSALRENDQVWIANPDSTLAIHSVEIHYRNRDDVLVSDGLEDGDLIVLTPISGAANGMALRPRLTKESSSPEMGRDKVQMTDIHDSASESPTAQGDTAHE